MSDTDRTVSVTAATKYLGVSRTSIWQMIADGCLDTTIVRRGSRFVTRVHLPALPLDSGDIAAPRSRTSQLQEQVERLTHAVESLSSMLEAVGRDRDSLNAGHGDTPAPPRQQRVEMEPATGPDPFPAGVTARPNPMTHPAAKLRPTCVVSRDDALEPVRELFRRDPPRPWWRRLPITARA